MDGHIRIDNEQCCKTVTIYVINQSTRCLGLYCKPNEKHRGILLTHVRNQSVILVCKLNEKHRNLALEIYENQYEVLVLHIVRMRMDFFFFFFKHIDAEWVCKTKEEKANGKETLGLTIRVFGITTKFRETSLIRIFYSNCTTLNYSWSLFLIGIKDYI